MNSTDIIEFEKKTYGSTPSYVFDKFWYFVAERQNIFFNYSIMKYMHRNLKFKVQK